MGPAGKEQRGLEAEALGDHPLKLVDGGIVAENVVTMNVDLSAHRYPEEQRAIDTHLKRANEAAKKSDTPRMHDELDQLNSEIQGQWDRKDSGKKGPGGIIER